MLSGRKDFLLSTFFKRRKDRRVCLFGSSCLCCWCWALGESHGEREGECAGWGHRYHHCAPHLKTNNFNQQSQEKYFTNSIERARRFLHGNTSPLLFFPTIYSSLPAVFLLISTYWLATLYKPSGDFRSFQPKSHHGGSKPRSAFQATFWPLPLHFSPVWYFIEDVFRESSIKICYVTHPSSAPPPWSAI